MSSTQNNASIHPKQRIDNRRPMTVEEAHHHQRNVPVAPPLSLGMRGWNTSKDRGRPSWVRSYQGRSVPCHSSTRRAPTGTPWWSPSMLVASTVFAPSATTTRRLTMCPTRRRHLIRILAAPIIDIDCGQSYSFQDSGA